MRKLFILFICLFIGKTLFSQNTDNQTVLDKLKWNQDMLNIMLDTRVDFQTTINDGNFDEATFRAQAFKLWIAGEIVPGIRYRVRHRLNKPQNPLREGYSAATDQAWVAFDIGKHWSITVGKQSVQFGTFEYDINPADIYVPTMCFNDLDAYKTGINAAFKFADQTLNLQIINSDAPQFANDNYKNKALSANFLWEGSLFKGLVKTRWGYGAFQHNKDIFYQWITPGIQLNINKFTAELDYYYGNRDMDYGSEVGNDKLGSRYVQDQSLSLNLVYDLGKFKPALKGLWNQRYDKDFDKKAYENMGIQAVMEYYPFSGLAKDLRFHLMYAYGKTEYKGPFCNLDDKNSHTILLGMRWLFKTK